MSQNHPLIEAAAKGDFSEVQHRVTAGESPDTRGLCSEMSWASNFTPLIVSSDRGYKTIVEFLISKGASVDAQESDGWTSLMYAASTKHTEICLILIKNGAKLDIQRNDGRTALHWACSNGKSEIVALLLKHGARTDIKDKGGKTPLDLAKLYNKRECVTLMTQHLRRLSTQRSLRAACLAKCAERVDVVLSRLPQHLQDEILALR